MNSKSQSIQSAKSKAFVNSVARLYDEHRQRKIRLNEAELELAETLIKLRTNDKLKTVDSQVEKC
jgi:hypothetical protein